MAKGKKANGIFTALGAATGLGNALRFPSLCASYGGGFVFAYVVSLVFVCFPLLCAELFLGKKFAQPLDKALQKCAPKLSWIAISAAVNSAVIALYYGVISAKLGGAFLNFAACGIAEDTGGFALFATGALSLFAMWFILRGKEKRMSHTGAVSVCASLGLLAILAVVVIAKGGSLSAVFRFELQELAVGGLWADALGQSLLALSLAGEVMPAFARSFGSDFQIAPTAVKIIAANLADCLLAAVATLALNPQMPEGGGVTIALALYPRVIISAFSHSAVRRLFGTLFFAALWLVALQSACSLFSPVLSLLGEKRRTAAVTSLCFLSLALIPVFSAGGLAALNAVDRMACSVNAVIIAFFEGLIFLSPRNMPELIAECGGFAAFMLKYFCPFACGALAVFSTCGARFSCFPAYAVFCAAICIACVFLPAFVRIARRLPSVSVKRRTFKSHKYL